MEPQKQNYDKDLKRDALANEQVRYAQDGDVYLRHVGLTARNEGASVVTLDNELVLQPNGAAIEFHCQRGEVVEHRYAFKFGPPNQNLVNQGLPPKSLVLVYMNPSQERYNQPK